MATNLLSRLAPRAALRQTRDGETPKVTNMELFFDLVYVFSIIQLSHYLLEHQTLLGALQFAILFAAVWWAWNYTAWATNWLDAEHPAGRLLMVGLMACALAMAIAMPSAYTETAGLFVGAYVVMGLLRAFYMALVFRGQAMGRNYAQLGGWSALAAVFWILGALSPENRTLLWLIAVLIDYAAPYAGFWIPGMGRTPMSSWPLAGLHLLERNQQVFIIALGESILLLGGTLAGKPLDVATGVAAASGFAIIVLFWWLYFVYLTEVSEEVFHHQRNHTELARGGLAYAHGIMVGSAIVVAVAIEQIIAHPSETAHLPTILTAALGPAAYLLGSILFYRALAARVPPRYFWVLLALLVFGLLVALLHLSGLVLGLGVLLILLSLLVGSRRFQR